MLKELLLADHRLSDRQILKANCSSRMSGSEIHLPCQLISKLLPLCSRESGKFSLNAYVKHKTVRHGGKLIPPGLRQKFMVKDK